MVEISNAHLACGAVSGAELSICDIDAMTFIH